MYRRAYLAGLAGLGLLGTAGCLGSDDGDREQITGHLEVAVTNGRERAVTVAVELTTPDGQRVQRLEEAVPAGETLRLEARDLTGERYRYALEAGRQSVSEEWVVRDCPHRLATARLVADGITIGEECVSHSVDGE